VCARLVLWDVDHTLVDAGGAGWHLYETTFAQMFGRTIPAAAALAGRTDRAIALDVLALGGITEPRAEVEAFQRLLAARAPGFASVIAARGRVLPGAKEALARSQGQFIQSVLTGNMRALAQVKLTALGLAAFVDLSIGAYGDSHEIRADLVPVARAAATAAYGGDFTGTSTVLVGDTPLDIEAALAAGARAVGVATGSSTASDLAAAGAHAVLPDLTRTGDVMAALTG
jgi:phosphoglycolate phosphatase-like HAD superfamily hydrolase